MRLARKLFLLLAAALAALAMSATTASASGPVEVHDETGAHCDPTCEIEVHGESQIIHPLAGPISTCEDTFHAEIAEDGSGTVDALVNQGHLNMPCTTRICDGDPGSEIFPWPFQIEESGAGEEEMVIDFCLESGINPNGVNCPGAVGHIEEHAPHDYEISMDFVCPSTLRVVGNWEIEDSPIEIEHPL